MSSSRFCCERASECNLITKHVTPVTRVVCHAIPKFRVFEEVVVALGSFVLVDWLLVLVLVQVG